LKNKVVSIEDRIPKLKEQRKRRANRRLITLLSLFFLLIAAVAYFQSPLSKVGKIMISGNQYIPGEVIVSKSGLSKDTNIWSIDKEKIKGKILKLPGIKDVSLSIVLPNSISIEIKEYKPVALMEIEQHFYPILENGKILKDEKTENINISMPILKKFEEGEALKEAISQLLKMNLEVKNSISEIIYAPKKTDPFRVVIFMNDGFEVHATLRTLADKMKHYPSIISQLDPSKKGIIDLEVGTFFKEYEMAGEEENENETER
jgi:cell division protein FtsQ